MVPVTLQMSLSFLSSLIWTTGVKAGYTQLTLEARWHHATPVIYPTSWLRGQEMSEEWSPKSWMPFYTRETSQEV